MSCENFQISRLHICKAGYFTITPARRTSTPSLTTMKLTHLTWIILSVLNRCHDNRRLAAANLRRLRWWCKHGGLKAHHARTLVRAADAWKAKSGKAQQELNNHFLALTA